MYNQDLPSRGVIKINILLLLSMECANAEEFAFLNLFQKVTNSLIHSVATL